MINNHRNRKIQKIKENKIFVKNSFYSFLNVYSAYIFTIFSSFIIARLISPQLWGFLFLSISYINIISLILSLLPPGLNYSINYYIPRYLVLNQNTRIKSFIKNGLILKIIFIIPVFIISILFFKFFSNIFEINLNEYTHLLFLISPLIIINSLNLILNSINQSFNMFKLVFLLLLLGGIINISALIFCFLFLETVELEIIAFISLFSALIPFIINSTNIIIKYLKIKPTKEGKLSFKNITQKSIKYGGLVSSGPLMNNIWNEIQIQSIGILESPAMVTGFYIAKNYSTISHNASQAFSQPLLTSFSRSDATQNFSLIVQVYNLVIEFSLFLTLFITGILYIITDFFLSFIFGESYLSYSIILKLLLISIIFRVLRPSFDGLMKSTEKRKYIPLKFTFAMCLYIPLFFIGFIYFGMIGAMLGIIFSHFFLFLVEIILSFKIFRIKVKKRKLFLLCIAFFISLGLTILLQNLFISKLNKKILEILNLLIFKNLEICSLILFVLMFIILNLIFKIFTRKDIEYLESYLNKEIFWHRLIQQGLNIVKRIIKN